MVKKAPSKLRALDPGLTRFVKDNVKDPARALADMSSIKNDAAPEPEHVQHEDLLSPAARGLRSEFDHTVTEVNGPAYGGPPDRHTYSRAASPAPAVSTSHPAAHPYTPAGGTGKVVYLPTGVNLPTGADPRE
jgi:hypothetical protein